MYKISLNLYLNILKMILAEAFKFSFFFQWSYRFLHHFYVDTEQRTYMRLSLIKWNRKKRKERISEAKISHKKSKNL